MTREFRLVRAGKCPTSSMGGGSLALLLEPRCSKFRGELTSLQAICSLELESLGVQPSPMWGASPFILQGGASCLHISIEVSWFRPGGPSSSSVGGPCPVGREWRGWCQVSFLGRWVVKLLSRLCPVGVASPLSRSHGGRLLSCPSVRAPPSVSLLHVLPGVASDRRTARLLRGALPRSSGAALSQSLA